MMVDTSEVAVADSTPPSPMSEPRADEGDADPEAEAEEDPPVMENSPEALPESPKTTKFSLVRVTMSEKRKVRLTDDDVVVTVLDFRNRYIDLTV